MRRYSINGGIGSATMSSTAKTACSVIATTAVRPSVYDIVFGTIGTAASTPLTITVTRASSMTAGTNNTSTTPNPLDSGDPASTSTGAAAWTTEPTIGTTLLSFGLNQQATMRWVAAPGGELIAPATANNGIAVRALSPTYTGDAQATIHFTE